MSKETSKPYGYFGSAEEILFEIRRRTKESEPILGSGLLFPGAVIIKGIDGSISMVCGEKEPPMLEFDVYPLENIVISSNEPIPGFGSWEEKT
ncbi:hypothetical protein HYW46_07380 [Candidatus Daviesbacteria bacterium]|nr:hypothetical protein [Candidatus Daviesbacteria bacterium]